MKHLFTIHSHITFLAALGTIVHENLRTEDVMLITGGGYEPRLNSAFKGKVIPSYDSLEASFSWWERIKYFNYTNGINRYIVAQTQGDTYIAYIDLMSVSNRYLVMHPKCEQFHVIEEGIVNYADHDDFNLWTADLRQFQWQGFSSIKQMFNGCMRLLRGRSLRLLAIPIHPNLYTLHKGVNAYCFSDSAFQYTPLSQKKVLHWSSIEKYVTFDGYTYPDDSWFWIGDTLCKSYKIGMNHFEGALQQLLEQINPKKEERVIYLKFRGSESQQEKNLTLQYLSRYNFKVEMIPSAIIVELIFLQSKNLTVCGIASSLLIYAHLMEHATHSLYPFIPNEFGVSLNQSYVTISKKVGFI